MGIGAVYLNISEHQSLIWLSPMQNKWIWNR